MVSLESTNITPAGSDSTNRPRIVLGDRSFDLDERGAAAMESVVNALLRGDTVYISTSESTDHELDPEENNAAQKRAAAIKEFRDTHTEADDFLQGFIPTR